MNSELHDILLAHAERHPSMQACDLVKLVYQNEFGCGHLIPDPQRAKANKRIMLEGDVPSPMRMPSGCPFRTRCSRATAQCAECRPELREVAPGHVAACHNL